MKSTHRQSLGRRGESIASVYLEHKGYAILDRNWRTPYGEIDLIASKDEVVAFIEVKTRSSASLGPPEISITRKKSEHMVHAAEYYIQQHPDQDGDWRIDLISIILLADSPQPMIDHFENVLA